MRRHAWEEARGLLEEADAHGALDAEGLRQLGKVYYWTRQVRQSVDAFERSYAAFVALGDRRGAAKVALMLRHSNANLLRDNAAARGWVQRAEHLLEGEGESREMAALWRAQGIRAFHRGEREQGEKLYQQAIDLGRRLGDANLVAMTMTQLAIRLSEAGRKEEAYAYMDEACAAALGGELGPWATGIVYCNAIGMYRDAGEFALGAEWTQTAGRWCTRESITGFSGICRVHRAEFMRLRGAWADAEREARVASGEMEDTAPAWAGDARYEIAEIRLRMGDLAGADQAFREAHELGRDPQPGAALLLMAQGQVGAALRSLETASPSGLLDEMRCLAAKVSLGCEAGDLAAAESAVDKSAALATDHPGLGVQVLHVQSRGTLELARGDPEAYKTLQRAVRMWHEIDAPYEVAQVRVLLARALRIAGDEAGSRRELEAAHGAFERLGAVTDAAKAKHLLDEPGGAPTVAERTLLFSDVVNSTQLVDAIGDEAWHDLLTWLDGSLRSWFASHGGEEVDHAGDGFFVAFPDSRSALECAITIQRKLADHRRSHGFAPRIRIGVHTTSASQSGGRYRGRGVHEASRIASMAGPDEILASRQTVPAGYGISEPRAVTVKGLAKPIEVVTVEWSKAL